MSRRGLRTVGAVLAAVVMLLSGSALPLDPAAAQTPATSNSVAIAVNQVDPVIPTPTNANSPLTFNLTITNRTGSQLDNVNLLAERDEPITLQSRLDSALASGQPSPDPSYVLPIEPTKPIKPLTLGPHASITVAFTTYTSTSTSNAGNQGICLCAVPANSIYPLFFSAHVTNPSGVDQVLGYGATYLAGTFNKPTPVQVAWLWPLVDRPHRLTSDDIFVDDDLTASVSPGGRLFRALDVAEAVADSTKVNVQLTLLIDPELIDELQVMSTGKYQVQNGKTTKPGTGQVPAQAWLARLRGLVATGAVDARLTPYADPDVESLTRHGLGWSATMPAAMQSRVSQALGGLPPATLSWPAGSALSTSTLDTLVKDGTSTVVLDSGAVRPQTDSSGVPVSLARLSSNGTNIVAALTSATIQKYADAALTVRGAGRAALPQLMAELAIRSADQSNPQPTVLITAPRYVDPDEYLAEQTILLTSSSRYTTPTSLAQLAGNGDLVPTGASQLAKAPTSAATLSGAALDGIKSINTTAGELKSMLDPGEATAQNLLAGLPVETQRLSSAGWHGLDAVTIGNSLAGQVADEVATTTDQVYIVTPTSGTYTLASSNSPLPITVENDSKFRVHVQVSAQASTVGLTTKNIGLQWIDAQSKRTLHLPTDVERSGRIRVEARLLAPDGRQLGDTVMLTVRSTALGIIGVIITIVAGVVLVLALVVRFVRRMRRRRVGPPDEAGAASLST